MTSPLSSPITPAELAEIDSVIARITTHELPPLFTDDTLSRGLAYLKRQMTQKAGLDHCARCLKRHTRLIWRPITRPTAFDNWLLIGFAFCPTTWEPILLAIAEDIRAHPVHIDPDPAAVVTVPPDYDTWGEAPPVLSDKMVPTLVYGRPVKSDPDYEAYHGLEVGTSGAQHLAPAGAQHLAPAGAHGPGGVNDADE